MPARMLYRAVSLAEAEDIRTTGAFRCIPGSMECKLFVTKPADAAKLARDVLFPLDREPKLIAAIELPERLCGSLLEDSFATDFGIRTVGIEEHRLPAVSAAGRVSILPFMPLPL